MIWDEAKREAVIKDHGIDFAKILDIFDDSFAVDFEDVEHSTSKEIRYKIIGMTARYGLVFVRFIRLEMTATGLLRLGRRLNGN